MGTEENFLKVNTRMHVKSLKLMLGLGLPWWPSNAGDPVSIPGSGRSPGEGNDYSGILAWRIPWTEEPGGLPPIGPQRGDTTEVT